MSVCGTHRGAFASKAHLRWGISIVGAALIALILGAPFASASPPIPPIPSVGIPAPPSLPSAPPPQPSVPTAPPVQVEVPTVPQVPVVKAATAKVDGTTPDSSHLAPGSSGDSTKASSPGVDLPAVDAIESRTEGGVGASTEEAHRTATAARGKGSAGDGALPSGAPADSLESARAAPLLLAYVWPAIALGPVAQKLLRALQEQWEIATSLAVSDVPRLLSGSAGAGGADRAARPSERAAASNPSPGDSRGIQLPSGGAISLLVFIISGAALMALLIYTVRREFRATHYRWPL